MTYPWLESSRSIKEVVPHLTKGMPMDEACGLIGGGISSGTVHSVSYTLQDGAIALVPRNDGKRLKSWRVFRHD